MVYFLGLFFTLGGQNLFEAPLHWKAYEHSFPEIPNFVCFDRVWNAEIVPKVRKRKFQNFTEMSYFVPFLGKFYTLSAISAF